MAFSAISTQVVGSPIPWPIAWSSAPLGNRRCSSCARLALAPVAAGFEHAAASAAIKTMATAKPRLSLSLGR